MLPHFVALTPGDIITIFFDNKHHVLEVLEVQPGRAVCLTESDVEVDFAPPLDGAPVPVSLHCCSVSFIYLTYNRLQVV